MDDRITEAEVEACPSSVGRLSFSFTVSPKLLAYFKAEDLPKVYGGKCECEGGCVLGRASHDVNHASLATIYFLYIESICPDGYYFSSKSRN